MLGLILLYIWWIRSLFQPAWIVLLALVLVSHLVWKESPARLGFRTAGFRFGLKVYGPFVFLVALALLALGMVFHTIRDISPEWALINLGTYFLWGTMQQYLLNGYFVNRFVRFSKHAPLLAAAGFAAAHTPNWFLMLVTCAGGYLSAAVYLRDRNLYFLGLAHGLLVSRPRNM